jgi:hypothetical protein
MEVATPVVVKTEPIDNVTNVKKAYDVYNESGIRVSRRLELIELAKARKAINEFGKSLRKTAVIPEKETPTFENVVADSNVSEDASASNVIINNDTDMAEDVSVNAVNTIETAEQVIARSDRRAEQILAESEAAIAARQEFTDEFGDTPIDEFDE